MTDSDDLFEDEIIDIFVEEVTEVVDLIDSNLQLWQANLIVDRPLKELRRAFHTLKGSGRMVSADAIGELGWAVENVLNRVIDGLIMPGNDIVQLVSDARYAVPKLLEAFKNKQSSVLAGVNIQTYIEQSDAIINGPKTSAPVLEKGVDSSAPVDNIRPAVNVDNLGAAGRHDADIASLLTDYHDVTETLASVKQDVAALTQKLQQFGGQLEQQANQAPPALPDELNEQIQQLMALRKDVGDLQYFVNSTSKQLVADQQAVQQQSSEALDAVHQQLSALSQQYQQTLNAARKTSQLWSVGASVAGLVIVFAYLFITG